MIKETITTRLIRKYNEDKEIGNQINQRIEVEKLCNNYY